MRNDTAAQAARSFLAKHHLEDLEDDLAEVIREQRADVARLALPLCNPHSHRGEILCQIAAKKEQDDSPEDKAALFRLLERKGFKRLW